MVDLTTAFKIDSITFISANMVVHGQEWGVCELGRENIDQAMGPLTGSNPFQSSARKFDILLD